MSSLIEVMSEMLKAEDSWQRTEAEHRFIEVLTFSNFDEIVAMLDKVFVEDWIGLPVWARNLAFRLACLLEPKNAEIRRRAAADLRCFGPDWDDEAEELQGEVAQIEEILRQSLTEIAPKDRDEPKNGQSKIVCESLARGGDNSISGDRKTTSQTTITR